MADDDKEVVFMDGGAVFAKGCSLDLTGADDVEILISQDGTKIWVNTPVARLRICKIRGTVVVNDMRLHNDGR